MNNPFLKKENARMLSLVLKLAFVIVLFFGVPYFIVSVSKRYEAQALDTLMIQNVQESPSGTYSETPSSGTDSTPGIKILTRVEVDTLAQISDFIDGTWISDNNPQYEIHVNSNNRFEEFYNEKKEGFGTWRVFSGIKGEVGPLNDSEFVLNGKGDVIDAQTITAPQATSADQGSAPTPAAGSLSAPTSSALSEQLQPDSSSTSSVASAYTQQQFSNPSQNDPKYFFQKEQSESKHKGEIYIYQIQQLDAEDFILVFRSGSGKSLVFKRATSTPMY